MRLISYSRVSTDDQADNGVSLDAQRDKARLYCELHEHTLVAELRDAASGKDTAHRPGLLEALAMLERGEADGLVVAKLDRLTRSLEDWSRLLRVYFGERSRHDVALHAISDYVDTSCATGRLVLNMQVSVMQWEREIIGERTREALAHKASKLERVGGIPYGWQLAADGVHVEPCEAEQRVAERARELRADGLALRKVGAQLAAEGHRPRNGRASWGAETVKRVLAAPQPDDPPVLEAAA